MEQRSKETTDFLTERFRAVIDGQLVDRRAFLAVLGALGVPAGLFRMTPALAAGTEIVYVNAGGDAVAAVREAFAKPFMAANPGVTITIDGSSATSGAIKSMVESGKVSWDIADRNLPAALELGSQGLLEEIDYSIVDRSKVRPEHVSKWGIGSYIFSFVLTWDTQVFKERAPKDWKDFWNVKEFPGRRMLRKHIDGQLEAALLADGVEPSKIYPIDVDRALEKIKQIKQHSFFWSTGAESQQMARDREVVMGNMFHTRAYVTHRETKGRYTFTFNQGSVWPGASLVLKGNPAGKEAFKFIASMQDPKAQVIWFQLLGNGPINPAADALVPEDMKRFNPGAAENYAMQVPADAEWYAENSAKALNRYIEAVS
ncbi:ABC transporter substrate-binding protein [Bosea sp. (in: a-proteobacteria)]|uniref:ABC transporter substrate-binding protein n=1 Tax=Bosea sp. (in: a-proteobacteria) TaxID=1871050 RepID=UPI0026132EDC|nr:polyamine ABC transporter substrate-binding protein [Bosea sp. (in: a-proteobacteria)]MCO5091312.1 polyamine ABC transporter substrate-binding protein [Bosea sp. (in: a-proteobacteria)]